MGFLPGLYAPKREWTSAALDAAVDAYFAHPFPTGEVPPIDGDPFTDAQEYPLFFSVQAAEPDPEHVVVPVRYDDGRVTRSVKFVLVREDGRFVVDDIRYPHGGSFRSLLATR
jgi:hypothetical protein